MRGLRPHVESMERRILLSAGLTGSSPRRLTIDLLARPGALKLGATAPKGNAPLWAARPGQSSGAAHAIPGTAGQATLVRFTLERRRAAFRNEIGLFLVDDATGRIGNLRPGDRGYGQAAISRRQVIFRPGQSPGTTTSHSLPGGRHYGMYLIQDATAERFLRRNPQNRTGRGPQAFFSFTAANPDRFTHARRQGDDVIRWEDMFGGGDRDFNDAVVSVGYVVTAPVPLPNPTPAPVSGPTIAAALAHDTAPDGWTNADGITTDPTVTGTVTASLAIATLRAGLNDASAAGFRDITADLGPDGGFRLDPVRLGAIFGSPLPDGRHTLHLRATDARGNESPIHDLAFTLDTRAPGVSSQSLSPRGTTRTNLTVTGIASDATSSVVRVQSRVDSGSFTDESFDPSGRYQVVSRLPLDGSADGPHTMEIRAQDIAGNLSDPIATPFTLDATAPTVVVTRPAASLTTTNADLTIEGRVADLGSGVARMTAQVDGGAPMPVDFDASGHFSLHTGLPLDGTADGYHSVTLRATDRADNASSPAVVTFQLDATSPLVVISNPGEGSAHRVNVTVTGRTTDDLSGVTSLLARVDDGPFVATSFDASGLYSFATALLEDGTADGSHWVRLRATDLAGNVSDLAGVTFVLDTTPPVVAIASPQTGLLTNQAVTVTGTVLDTLAGALLLEAGIDSGAYAPVTFDPAAGGSFSVSTGLPLDGTADGPHTVRLRATDRVGNVSAHVDVSFTLDATAPPITLGLDPASDTAPVGDNITDLAQGALIGVTEPGSTVTLLETGATTTADGQGHYGFPGVSFTVGSSLFHVETHDPAGNLGAASLTIRRLEAPADQDGWTTDQQGGTAPGEGSVVVQGGDFVLTEGNSFRVTLGRTFTVPANPTVVSFTYANLSFDTTDTRLINDAFEVALLGDDGRSIVPTFAPGRDAFFNNTEGLEAATATGATVADRTVTVDISGAFSGSSATLVFRLVNNDSDAQSTVTIVRVQVPDGQGITTAATTMSPDTPEHATSLASSPAVRTVSVATSPSAVSSPRGNATHARSAGAVISRPVVSLAPLSSRGKEFWLAFPGNGELIDPSIQKPESHSLFLAGDVATSGSVAIPGLGFSASFSVTPGQVTTVSLPADAEIRSSGVVEAKGIHVTSEAPVTVYGLSSQQSTSDAYLGLPTETLGRDYLAFGYGHPHVWLNSGSSGGTQFTLVGTEDGTSVTVTPTGVASSTAAATVVARDPTGKALFTLEGDPGFKSPSFLPLDVDAQVLERSGTYSVTVRASDPSRTGTYRFRWLDLEQDAIPLAIGQIAQGSLTRPGFRSEVYSFSGKAGQAVWLDDMGTMPNFLLSFLPPQGGPLQRLDEVYVGTITESGILILPQSGRYYLSVQPGEGFVDYRFRLLDLATTPTLPLNAEISARLDTGSETLIYRFEGHAGESLYYDGLAGDVREIGVSLFSPSRSTLVSGVNNPDVLRDQFVTLSESGTHYLVFQGLERDTLKPTPPGTSFRFRLLDVPSAPPLASDTQSGRLATGQHADLYQIEIAEPQRLRLAPSSPSGRISLTLWGPERQTIAGPPFFPGSPIEGTILRPGTYTLVVATPDAGPLDYTIQRTSTVFESTPLSGFDLVQEAVIQPGGQASFSFTAPADRLIFVDGLESNPQNLGGSIRGPSGGTVLSSFFPDSGTGGDSPPFLLRESGTFTFTLSGVFISEPRTYRFRFREVQGESVPLPLGDIVSGTLETGWETDIYSFDGSIGQKLYFDAIQTPYEDVILDLVLPSGGKYRTLNQPGQGPGLILPETGRYSLLIRGRAETRVDYQVRLVDLDTAPVVSPGDVLDGTLASSTNTAFFRFEGAAGQRLYYDALDADNDVSVRLAGPGDAFFLGIGNNYIPVQPGTFFGEQTDRDVSQVFLKDTGTYYLIVRSRLGPGGGATDYRFRFLDLDAAPVLPMGQTVGVALASGTEAALYRIEADGYQEVTFTGLSLTPGVTGTWDLRWQDGTSVIGPRNLGTSFTAVLERSGTYNLVITTNNPSVPVAFSFQATSKVPSAVPVTGFGEIHEAQLAPGEEKTFTFTAPAGRLVYFDTTYSRFYDPPFQVTLDRGETYQLRTPRGTARDLTGTLIAADQPIAVFGGHDAASIPSYRGFTDHLVEQLPPVDTWGREFVSMPLATRLFGDTYRFLASENRTTVRVNGEVVAHLDRGDFVERILEGPLHITSDRPILAAQFAHGADYEGLINNGSRIPADPFMMLTPPVEQFLPGYTVSTPATGFARNFLNLVVPTSAVGQIQLDGNPILAASFTPIGASGYSGAQIEIGVGSHNVAGSRPFGLSVYGFNDFNSYGYPGGMAVAPLAGPSIEILSPADGAEILAGTTALISGRALPGSPQASVVLVSINGVPVEALDSAGNFFTRVHITPGRNMLELTAMDVRGQTAAVTLTLDGVAKPAGKADLSLVSDVSASFAVEYARTSFREQTDVLYADLAVHNTGGYPVDAPLFVGVANVSDPTVRVRDAAGKTPEGIPYYDFTALVAGDTLPPDGLTGSLSIAFFNPERVRFTYDVVFFGKLDRPPSITSVPAVEAIAGRSYAYAARAEDPDGDALTFSLLSGPAAMSIDATTGAMTWSPESGDIGSHPVVVRVEDGRGGSVDQSFILSVIAPPPNRPPVVTSLPVVDAVVDTAYAYRVEAIDSDGDAPTFAIESGPSGLAIAPDTGAISWTPTSAQLGDHAVTLEVDDGHGATSSQSFSIRVRRVPANAGPVSANAPVITSSPPAGPVSVGTPYQYQLRAQDADGDPVRFRLDAAPDGMTIDAVTGLLRWTPTSDQVGTRRVVLVAEDDHGASTDQSFDLSAALDAPNDPPNILSDPRIAIRFGSTYRYAVRAADANGDPLRYILEEGPFGMTMDATGLVSWAPTADQLGTNPVRIRVEDGRDGTATQTFSIDVASQADNEPPSITSTPPLGTVVGRSYRYDARAIDLDGDPILWGLDTAPAGMTIDEVTGAIRWAPGPGQPGGQAVVVRASDGQGGSSVQSFTVIVRAVNSPPVVTSSPPTQAHGGNPYFYAVRASDPDGDPLSFSVAGSSGMTIDPKTGLIRWTPTGADVAIHEIVVLVSDGELTSSQAFDLDVSSSTPDNPPTILSVPGFVATVDVTYTYQVTAVDPEARALTYALLSAPAGMSITPSGRIEWTPDSGQIGGHRAVTIAANDPAGNLATQSFTLSVLGPNRPPQITSNPILSVTSGSPYRYDVRATDPDGEPVRFRLDEAPAGMTIDPVLGRIGWTPVQTSGTQHVVVTVTDPRGLTDSQTYDVTVQPDAEAPKITLSLSANPITIGKLITFLVTASDNVGVTALGLTIDGKAIALDANGRATVAMDALGTFTVIALATDAWGNSSQSTASLLVNAPGDAEAPVVAIASPADDAVITGPVPVTGTVSDANLADYTLELEPVAGGAAVVIARGTSGVTDGVLGTLDPSRFANDTYILRLVAHDAGGHTSTDERLVSFAGELKLGNFTLSFTDLAVPVSGIPITVGRTYDSLNAATQGDFGHGWRLEFGNTDLRTGVAKTGAEADGLFNAFRDKTRVYVTLPGGRREGFTFQPQPAPGLKGSFLGIFHGQFVPDAGVTDSLTVESFDLRRFSDGSYGDYGGSLPYNPADPAFGGTFTLTTKEGIVYTIDGLSGKLRTVADRNGNSLEFSDAGIFSGSGQRVTFERDPRGRISAVVDPSGGRIAYRYDARGDLVSVTDRAGSRTQFVYRTDRPHYLERVIDPLGRTGIRSEYDDQGRLFRLVDADGNPVRLEYDPARSTQTVVDPLGNATVYTYDDRGNVVATVDALGGATRYTYDANNDELTVEDPLHRITTRTYDARGNVLTETDPLGHVTRTTYDRHGNVLTQTDALGNTTTNAYDARGNLIEMRDPSGKVTRFRYDASGNPLAMADAVGTLYAFEYDAAGQVTRQVDALGNATVNTYDAGGRLLTETRTLTTPTGVRTLVTRTEYDAEGRVIKVTDAEGGVTETRYNAAGQKIASIDALGRTTVYAYDDRGRLVETIFPDATPDDLADNPRTRAEYDAAGRQVATIDEAGRRTEMQYDALGRPVATVYPDATPADPDDNPRTRTEYDASGRQVATIDELGRRTEFVYDAGGRQTVVRDALGGETTTTYDDAGRSVRTTDALGHATQFVHDAAGRAVRTNFADGTSVSSEFDARGRVIARTDQLGRATRYEYDAADRLVAVVDALDRRTAYGYDEAGDLVTQTDANGHVTRYEYDGLGRRIATVLPLGQRSTSVYDAVGNVVSTTDFNGQSTTFDHDLRDRLLARHFPDGTSTTFAYTSTGQRQAVVDARGTTTYAYDARDRLTSRTDPDGTAISYTYDPVGNRTSVTIPSGTTRYTFDALNRASTVTDPDQGVTRYAYDAIGDLLRTERPDGTVETRAYDVVGHLLSIDDRGPDGSVIESFHYTLAATGRRDAVVEQDGRKVEYRYDLLDRLIGELITDPDRSTRGVDYTYDPVGNRLTRTDSAEGETVYTYDDNDRLLTETLGSQLTQYTYDDNGNTLSNSASAVDRALYEWDAENRLVGATVTDSSGTKRLAYRYDADGIRVSSTVDGDETRYLIDTVQPYAQVVEEYTPGGVIKVSYVYGNDLISQERGGSLSYYHVDGLGSTRALTDGSGLVTDRYVYDAFGRTIGQVGSTGNLYLFAGEQRDVVTGLDYLRARYMEVGRFISRDPAFNSLQEPISLHKYIYGNDNPANLIDPSGYSVLGMAIVGGGLLTVGFYALSRYYAHPILTAIYLDYSPLGRSLGYVKDLATGYITRAILPLKIMVMEGKGTTKQFRVTFYRHVEKALVGEPYGEAPEGGHTASVYVGKILKQYKKDFGQEIDEEDLARLIAWTAIHEIGHAIGLPHKSGTIMAKGDEHSFRNRIEIMHAGVLFDAPQKKMIRDLLSQNPLK